MSILLFLIETKFGRTIAITGAIIIGLGIGWLSFSTHYYNKGWAAALHAIAAQDQKAVDQKNQALETVKNCRDSGGTWDVVSDSCTK